MTINHLLATPCGNEGGALPATGTATALDENHENTGATPERDTEVIASNQSWVDDPNNLFPRNSSL
jgi:hypothetical protein